MKMHALLLPILILITSRSFFLPTAFAQPAQRPVDTLGGACSLPISSSSCPYPCPVIDGQATCVPLLESCASCAPSRGPTDGVCDPSLVCDAVDRECRGVPLAARCGSNGKTCDEGLICVKPNYPGESAPRVCFDAGGVGDACDIAVPTRTLQVGTNADLKGCAEGLTCLPPVGSADDDGRKRNKNVCSVRTGEGEPCVTRWCGKGLGCSRKDGVSLCRRLGGEGDTCDVDSSPCAEETAGGRALVCAAGTCSVQSTLGAACGEGKAACPQGASCAQTASGEMRCLEAVRAGFKCDDQKTTCWREGAGLVSERFVRMGRDTRCDGGICAEDTGAGGLFQLCDRDADDCSPSGRVCAKSQDGQMRCLDLGGVGSTCFAGIGSWGGSNIAGVVCPEGASCELEAGGGPRSRSLVDGTCVVDTVAGDVAGLGELCDLEKSLGVENFTRCAETVGSGNRLVCAFTEPESQKGRLTRCVRRIGNGEPCGAENTVCDETNRFRRASCNSENNLCEVKTDLLCNGDSDCKTADGESCVLFAKDRRSSRDQFICAKFNQERGQECQRGAPGFGGYWTVKCKQSFTCYNAFPGRMDVSGICVTLVRAGERCSDAENIVCDKRNACLNGTCTPLKV